MTDEPLPDIELDWRGERPNYPRAKPWERLTGGIPFDDINGTSSGEEKFTGAMRAEDIFGFCPPEEFEGFEEWRREFRARELARKPKI